MKCLIVKYLCILSVVALLFAPDAHAYAASPTWEMATSFTVDNPDSERFDVRVRDGYIIVTTERAVNVKLFSILGQLISQQTLQPGVWRLKVKARGVYILKTDTTTRRVTV